jgi:hypothetical protein
VGYEVLDSGSSTGADDVRPAAPVHDLDALPPVAAAATLRRLTDGVPRRTLAAALVLALVVVALAALGGYRAGRDRARSEAARAARGQVHALAATVGGIGTNAVRGKVQATTQVVVTNAGDLPVQLVATASVVPQLGRPAVLVAGRPQIAAGGQATARVSLLLDCSGDTALPVAVDVLAPDGSRHPVPVQSGGTSMTTRDACAQVALESQPFVAELTGSLGDPLLHLVNRSAAAVTVRLDGGAAGTQAASQFLSVTTTPGFPVTVDADSERTLGFVVRIEACHRDLRDVLAGGTTVIDVRAEPVRSGGPIGSRLPSAAPVSVPVDVSALLSGALARGCPSP